MGNRRHPRAKLTVEGRMLLVHRVVDLGWPRARAAEAQGCSAATVGKWLGRFEQEGAAGLVDRCSRPRRSPNRMPEAVEEQILEYRTRHRVGAHHIQVKGCASTASTALAARRDRAVRFTYPSKLADWRMRWHRIARELRPRANGRRACALAATSRLIWGQS